MSVKDILMTQSERDLTDRQVLVSLHVSLGHTPEQISEYMNLRLATVALEIAAIGLPPPVIVEPAPVVNASAERLRATIADAVNAAPKGTRKAAPKKPAKAPSKASFSPLEVNPAEWSDTHALKYIEIRWCEMKWQTPYPSWGARDYANIKRLMGEYGGDSLKKIIDVVFDNWTALQQKFSWTGLPSTGILWGFRNSLAPIAFGDTAVTQGAKSWGSAHKTDNDRDDGDEVGW